MLKPYLSRLIADTFSPSSRCLKSRRSSLALHGTHQAEALVALRVTATLGSSAKFSVSVGEHQWSVYRLHKHSYPDFPRSAEIRVGGKLIRRVFELTL